MRFITSARRSERAEEEPVADEVPVEEEGLLAALVLVDVGCEVALEVVLPAVAVALERPEVEASWL